MAAPNSLLLISVSLRASFLLFRLAPEQNVTQHHSVVVRLIAGGKR